MPAADSKIEIELTLPGLLRESANGATTIQVSGITVLDCLNHLTAQFPNLKRHLYDEDGATREHILFFLNEDNIKWLGPPDQLTIKQGDVITILQAVSGG